MVFYPDNANRSQRVSDLANSIAILRSDLSGQVEAMKTEDKLAYDTLQRLSTAAGYKTCDEYLAAMLKQLPDAQRKKFEKMQEQIKKQGQDVDISLNVFGALSIAVVVRILTSDKILNAIVDFDPMDILRYICSWRNALNVVDAAADVANEIPMTTEAVTRATADAVEWLDQMVVDARAGAAAAAEALRIVSSVVKIGADVLTVISVAGTIGTLIYDGVEGKMQMDLLKKYTLEACAKRFTVKHLQLQAQKVTIFYSQATAIIFLRDLMNQKVAAGKIAQAEADSTVDDAILDLIPKFDMVVGSVTDDAVLASLKSIDEDSKSWTKEDPDLAAMQKWIHDNSSGLEFTPMYQSTTKVNGVGGFNMMDARDRIFAYDYNGSGKQDHLVCFRHGSGYISILERSEESFKAVYSQPYPGEGIGGCDLRESDASRACTIDYDHTTKQDHILFYGAGTPYTSIIAHDVSKNVFSSVYTRPTNDGQVGVGGFDMLNIYDQAFPFDYEHSGKMDYLVCYRPGRGAVSIIKNVKGVFKPVFESKDHGAGIGGFDLSQIEDRAFALDYEHSGKMDYLVFYRPGSGICTILKNEKGEFKSVFSSKTGIGGWDLADKRDLGLAFDLDGTGKRDNVCWYRPGTGIVWVLENGGETGWKMVVKSGNGLGVWDLSGEKDLCVLFDGNSTGRLEHLVWWRPGEGKVAILHSERS